MTKHEIREWLKTLETRLHRAQQRFPYCSNSAYEARLSMYIGRLQQAIADFQYDLNEVYRERDIPSYEDCQELHEPCEHPGDDWKNNEDI